MGKFLISLGALVLTGMLASTLVYGASTSGVAVTVAAQSISLTVSDGAVAYGAVPLSGTASTTVNGGLNGGAGDTQTVTNNGNSAETFNIKGQDASSTGTPWTLSNSAIGANQYMHEVCTSTCNASPTWRKMSTAYSTLDSNKGVGATSLADLQISLPSSSSDTYNHSADLVVQAISYP